MRDAIRSMIAEALIESSNYSGSGDEDFVSRLKAWHRGDSAGPMYDGSKVPQNSARRFLHHYSVGGDKENQIYTHKKTGSKHLVRAKVNDDGTRHYHVSRMS